MDDPGKSLNLNMPANVATNKKKHLKSN